MMRKTFSMKTDAAVADRKWHVVDVAGMTLGRAAHPDRPRPARQAQADVHPARRRRRLRGRASTPSKVHLTGKKWRASSTTATRCFPGGLTTFTAEQLLKRNPTELIERAVWGMLPKGPLGRRIYKKLKVYAGDKHPHAAQPPAELKLQPAR